MRLPNWWIAPPKTRVELGWTKSPRGHDAIDGEYASVADAGTKLGPHLQGERPHRLSVCCRGIPIGRRASVMKARASNLATDQHLAGSKRDLLIGKHDPVDTAGDPLEKGHHSELVAAPFEELEGLLGQRSRPNPTHILRASVKAVPCVSHPHDAIAVEVHATRSSPQGAEVSGRQYLCRLTVNSNRIPEGVDARLVLQSSPGLPARPEEPTTRDLGRVGVEGAEHLTALQGTKASTWT